MNNLAAIINEQGLLPLTTIIKISIAFILGGIIGWKGNRKGNRSASKPALFYP